MAVTLNANGSAHGVDVDVDGDTPLLWVLRDVLGRKLPIDPTALKLVL